MADPQSPNLVLELHGDEGRRLPGARIEPSVKCLTLVLIIVTYFSTNKKKNLGYSRQSEDSLPLSVPTHYLQNLWLALMMLVFDSSYFHFALSSVFGLSPMAWRGQGQGQIELCRVLCPLSHMLNKQPLDCPHWARHYLQEQSEFDKWAAEGRAKAQKACNPGTGKPGNLTRQQGEKQKWNRKKQSRIEEQIRPKTAI